MRRALLALLPLILAACVAGPYGAEPDAGSPDGTLRIAAFNIQVFGLTKASKPEVMSVLARTARNFDVMSIEEIRDESDTTLQDYLDAINSLPGPEYAAIESPRLGRTSSKESYAFVYDTATVEFVNGSDYVFADPPPGTSADLFQREPFIARFRSVDGDFTFVLIVIHTEPDATPQELSDMPKVLADAQARFPAVQEFIMLGDMNADCGYLKPTDPIPLRNSSFIWLIPDSADTTTKSTDCAYDRIIIPAEGRGAYAGNWGVFRFDKEYGLGQNETEAVSDHYPVWAGFRAAGQ